MRSDLEILAYLAMLLLLFVGSFVAVWMPGRIGLIGGGVAIGALVALWLKSYWK